MVDHSCGRLCKNETLEQQALTKNIDYDGKLGNITQGQCRQHNARCASHYIIIDLNAGEINAYMSALRSSDGRKRAIFHNPFYLAATAVEKRVFVDECISKAFDAAGSIKPEYGCSDSKFLTQKKAVLDEMSSNGKIPDILVREWATPPGEAFENTIGQF